MHSLVIFVAKYLVILPPLVWCYVLLRLPRQQRLRFIVFTAVSAVAAVILMKIAGAIHNDPRPFVRDHVHPYFTHTNDNGFPSDHTVLGSFLAFVIWRYRRWLGGVLLVVAIGIGTARVISGIHHGQDIVAGVVVGGLGVAIGWAFEKLYDSWRRSLAARKA